MKKWFILLIDFLSLAILIFFDQWTKMLAVSKLKNQSAFVLINGVLELNYLENKGAAFGMLQNQMWFFIFIAVLIIGVISYILAMAPMKKKYAWLHVLLTFIAAGAVGNMIDRIRLEYVVDFIYFRLINFPIFNVADIYVTVCTILLVIVLLFVYKEEDLKFLSFRQNKYRALK